MESDLALNTKRPEFNVIWFPSYWEGEVGIDDVDFSKESLILLVVSKGNF